MRRAFTLVELMVVVAIIGILASIAIPNFMDMQYRAKRAEVPLNVDGIRTAEIAYEISHNAFIQEIIPQPRSVPNKEPAFWTEGSNFDDLGWAPDGAVRGLYSITTVPVSSTSSGDFEVTGMCDVDFDTIPARYTATKSINTTFQGENNTF